MCFTEQKRRKKEWYIISLKMLNDTFTFPASFLNIFHSHIFQLLLNSVLYEITDNEKIFSNKRSFFFFFVVILRNAKTTTCH